MSAYTVTYNGVTDRSVGCHAQRRPSIPAPVENIRQISIPGRDEDFYESEGTYGDITIVITFSFHDRDPDTWAAAYRAVKHWLLTSGAGTLRFSDDAGVYYKVHTVRISSAERVSKRIGTVTAEFVCEAYTYLDSGESTIPFAATIQNPYDVCHPIYHVQGSGTCILTVNQKAFRVIVNSVATIDSDIFATYATGSGTFANTSVDGDYQDLWLKPGNNALSISSGFTCTLVPRWRCL
jgi:predicted phage tail component-like protein